MNNKLNGFILSATDYKENDSMLQVLTKEYGIISFIAKGSKKLTSHHHYMPYSVYEFLIDYVEHKTIFVIKSAKLLKNYYEESISKIAYYDVFSESLIKNKELINEDDYDQMIFLFENINDNNKYLLGSLFFSNLLKKSGITPQVDGCVVCANSKIIGLSNIKGGFVCKEHALEMDVLDVETLKKFRLIIKAQYKDYEIIKNFKFDKKDFSLVIDFYIENSGIKLKAYDFFKSI